MVARWLCAAVLLLFIVPVVGADRDAIATDLSQWLSHSTQPGGSEIMFFGDFSYIDLYRLGDADGDGLEDLLVGSAQGDATEYTAYSGADLATALWTSKTSENSYEYPAADFNGDGVIDLSSFTYNDGSGVNQWQGTPVGSAQAGTNSGAHGAAFLSGTKHDALSEHALPWTDVYGRVYASAAVAYASVRPGVDTFTDIEAIGPDSLMRVEYIGRDLYAYHGNTAGSLFARVDEYDLLIDLLDLSGAVRGEIDFIDPTAAIMGGAPADLNGDGVTDILLVNGRTVSGYAYVAGYFVEVPLLIPEILAYNGADGSALWNIERPSTYGYPALVIPVGDVNGDGGQDIGYLEVNSDVTGMSYTFDLLILSGKNGAILSSMPGETSPWLPLAFGDVNGDGAAEMLLVDLESETQIQVVDSHLKALWSANVQGFPLNFHFDDYFGYPRGASDVTGDGAPDLVLSNYASYDDYAGGLSNVELLDGTTGLPTWTSTDEALEDAWVVADLSSVGTGDLFILTVNGDAAALEEGDYDNATVAFDILRGEDRTLLWHQVLRDPVSAPMTLKDGSVWVDVRNVGDLDGDGKQELAVLVEESTGGFMDELIIMASTGQRSAQRSAAQPAPDEMFPEEEFQTRQFWYIFSSKTGQPIATLGGQATGMGGPVALRAVADSGGESPPLPEGEFHGEPAEGEPRGQDSPGAGLGFVVLAFAAVAFATRRRNA